MFRLHIEINYKKHHILDPNYNNQWQQPQGGPQGQWQQPQQPQGGPRGPWQQPPQYSSTSDFVGAIKTCISKYVDFNGRAGRPEFWWWTLLVFLLTGVLAFQPWVSSILSAAVLLPNLAVTWRRLHDIGKAGGYFFIGLIPIVGWIILIIWLAQPSQPGPNRFGYGPDNIHINRPPFV